MRRKASSSPSADVSASTLSGNVQYRRLLLRVTNAGANGTVLKLVEPRRPELFKMRFATTRVSAVDFRLEVRLFSFCAIVAILPKSLGLIQSPAHRRVKLNESILLSVEEACTALGVKRSLL